VLIEAMAAGVPCVATDVGDCAAILAGTGLTVPPRDPGGLAAGIERLLTMPPQERLARVAAARRRVLAEFALAGIAVRYLELYTRVLADRAFPRRTTMDGASACAD
jgi:glycosyltransferase involved in cell wall biosynthesis